MELNVIITWITRFVKNQLFTGSFGHRSNSNHVTSTIINPLYTVICWYIADFLFLSNWDKMHHMHLNSLFSLAFQVKSHGVTRKYRRRIVLKFRRTMKVSGYVNVYPESSPVDYLDIYDGSSTESQSLGQFWNHSSVNTTKRTYVNVTSSSNQILLHLHIT